VSLLHHLQLITCRPEDLLKLYATNDFLFILQRDTKSCKNSYLFSNARKQSKMNISALNTKITRRINVFKLQYHRMAKLLTVYEGQLVTPFEQHDVAGDS